MKKEKEKGITITFVGKQEPNIINNWLDENGNIEIAKQVEKEAKDLCEQETLEEAMNNNGYHDQSRDALWREGVNFGVKWKQEQDKNKYSEEDMMFAYEQGARLALISQSPLALHKGEFPTPKEWFEQFKNK